MKDRVIQLQYALLLGEHLEGFRRVRDNEFNMRCPLCGDSAKNKSKRRGYLLLDKEGYFYYYCHNCGINLSFEKFLETVDNPLYLQMKLDTLSSGLKFKKKEEEIKVSKWTLKEKPKDLISIEDLPENHKALTYLKGRSIPEESFKRVKWTSNFPELVSRTIGEKYKDSKLPHEGLIFELRDFETKEITGYQIRSIDPNCPKSQRFIICDINQEHGFFFDPSIEKPSYVLEGCIDSLFLPNSLAVLSASLWKFRSKDALYINDCEPRNREVCKQIEKCISLGNKTVLLPLKYEGKDINDIFKTGISLLDFERELRENCFSGFKAKIKFQTKWKKI